MLTEFRHPDRELMLQCFGDFIVGQVRTFKDESEFWDFVFVMSDSYSKQVDGYKICITYYKQYQGIPVARYIQEAIDEMAKEYLEHRINVKPNKYKSYKIN